MPQKTLIEWIVVTAFCSSLAILATTHGWLWRIDQAIYDTTLLSRTQSVDRDIIIVAIDEQSLAEIGHWPWPRSIHALLTERLHHEGARAIAFDVIFSEEDKLADLHLAKAFQAYGSVILPIFHARHGHQGSIEIKPVSALSEVTTQGHIHVELDPDGIARSVYLWEGLQQPRYPQFALAILRQAWPEQSWRWPSPPQLVGEAWQRAEWLRIPFVGPPGSFTAIAYSEVLRGNYPEDFFRNAMVLVGATAAGLGDTIPVPTSGHSRGMPGVELHANVLQALRHNAGIQSTAPWKSAALAGLVVLLLMLLIPRVTPRSAILYTVLTILAVPLLASILLWRWHIWLPPAGTMLALLFTWPVWSWRRLEAAQHYLDTELRAMQAETNTLAPATAHSLDNLDARLHALREATAHQRLLRRSREDTLFFLSHDLRAPLYSLLITLERKHNQPTTPTPDDNPIQRRYIRSALQLIENLLRMIRADGIDKKQFRALSIDMIINDAIDLAWPLATEKQITIQSYSQLPEHEPALVFGDEDLLSRAILNLLTNAIKYSEQQSTVSIYTDANLGHWRVCICDCGVGISAEQQNMLFNRFSRLRSEYHQHRQGIGLGLLMVHTVMERHGGNILVESEKGLGSCFILSLPKFTDKEKAPDNTGINDDKHE